MLKLATEYEWRQLWEAAHRKREVEGGLPYVKVRSSAATIGPGSADTVQTVKYYQDGVLMAELRTYLDLIDPESNQDQGEMQEFYIEEALYPLFTMVYIPTNEEFEAWSLMEDETGESHIMEEWAAKEATQTTWP